MLHTVCSVSTYPLYQLTPRYMRVGPLSESDNTLCEWGKIATG